MSKNEKRKGQKEVPKDKEALRKQEEELRRRLVQGDDSFSRTGFLGIPY